MLNYILNAPKKIAVFFIRVYQKTLSFDHSFWANPSKFRVCIYSPSCSEYTAQAITKYGLVKGGWMGTKRVASCNGLSKGGYDPVT